MIAHILVWNPPQLSILPSFSIVFPRNFLIFFASLSYNAWVDLLKHVSHPQTIRQRGGSDTIRLRVYAAAMNYLSHVRNSVRTVGCISIFSSRLLLPIWCLTLRSCSTMWHVSSHQVSCMNSFPAKPHWRPKLVQFSPMILTSDVQE